MYIYSYIHIYIYIYIYIYIHIYTFVHVYICQYMQGIHTYTYRHMYACMQGGGFQVYPFLGWMSRVTCKRAMSRVNEPCHVWMSHITWGRKTKEKRALHTPILQNSLIYPQQSPTYTQKSIHILKRALYTLKWALHTPCIHSKEPYIPWKIWVPPPLCCTCDTVSSKEHYIHPKEPCIHSKEPCIHSKEPYIQSKSSRYTPKSPAYTQMSPTCTQKSRTYPDKSESLRHCVAHAIQRLHKSPACTQRAQQTLKRALHALKELNKHWKEPYMHHKKTTNTQSSLLHRWIHPKEPYTYKHTLKGALHTLTNLSPSAIVLRVRYSVSKAPWYTASPSPVSISMQIHTYG